MSPTQKQWLAERRRRNQALAAQDQAHRCATCKRNLSEVGQILEDFLLPGKFCSDACLDEARERAE